MKFFDWKCQGRVMRMSKNVDLNIFLYYYYYIHISRRREDMDVPSG